MIDIDMNSFQMTDILTTEGYTDAGYTYVNVDDCWLSHSRDKFGRLQADPQRFPSGMKSLADYVRIDEKYLSV